MNVDVIAGADLTREQRQANAATHKTRVSDSSLYDEICTVCGARDWTMGPDEIGDRPCSQSQSKGGE
jgi:cytochrome c5